jgi:hypothetical protein
MYVRHKRKLVDGRHLYEIWNDGVRIGDIIISFEFAAMSVDDLAKALRGVLTEDEMMDLVAKIHVWKGGG